MALVLTRPRASFAVPSPAKPSVVKVRMPQWTARDYIVREVSARWLRTEGQEANTYDVYEVKGWLRKKTPQASETVRVTVVLRLAGFSAGFITQTVSGLSERESKPFTVRVDEGTLAKERGTDVEFFITVEPIN